MEEPSAAGVYLSGAFGESRPEDIVSYYAASSSEEEGKPREEKLRILVYGFLNGKCRINMEMQMAPFELCRQRQVLFIWKDVM